LKCTPFSRETNHKMVTIVTTRFNHETYFANYAYRKKHPDTFSCIYCSPCELSSKIAYGTPVFVIEMNNSTNQVLGIGLIRNRYETTRYYKVHSNGNWNRYIYVGKSFVSRDFLLLSNPAFLYALEEILFKGKTHSKRGNGFTCLPEKLVLQKKKEGIDIPREIQRYFHKDYDKEDKEANKDDDKKNDEINRG